MKLEIGNKKLSELTAEQIIDIALIEGVHSFLEYWGKPIIIDIDKTMFSDSIVVDYNQERKKDGLINQGITLFFNIEDLSYHWHPINDTNSSRSSKRIGMETIKYLIKNGFDLPIY